MNQVTATKSHAQSTAAAAPPQTIQDLPAGIREKIFSELSATEALSVRLVCKEWNVIISGDRLRNFFLHRDFTDCTDCPCIENAQQTYILMSNIDHGKCHRQDLEGSMQTPIIYADGLIIYGSGLPYLDQTIRILDTRTGDCLTIRVNTKPASLVSMNFETLVYAEGFIFAAHEKQPLILGWDARTGDKIAEIKTRGIVGHLVYNDGMFFLSFADNHTNVDAGIWDTVEIWDFNSRLKTRTETPAEQSTLEADPECVTQTLPPEVMQIIFSKLRVPDASRARIVCRDWNTMINDIPLWRLFLNRDIELRKNSSSIENPKETYILQSNLKNTKYTSLIYTLSDRRPPLCFAENKIIYAAKDQTIKVCDAVTGDCIGTLEGNGANAVKELVYANGKLLSLCRDYMLTIWDIETGDCCTHKDPYLSPQSLQSLTYGDGRVFMGDMEGKITSYDLEEGRLINTLQGKGMIHRLSYADGILYCSYMCHPSEMWDFNHGEAVEQSAEDKEKQT